MNKKVSIIIPVYNTSSYLDKCISSILNQTYNNIEIIIIDDGSTDNSLEILKKYQKIDKRIKVLIQENQGQGVARNYGIDEATGEYICFVDSDDRIDKFMIEKLLKNIIKENSDFSSCLIAFEDEKKVVRYKKNFNVKNLEGENQVKDSYFIKNIFPIACNKIFKTNFLKKNNIVFPKVRKNEDMLFIHKVVLYSKKCSFINEVLYYAYRRKESTSRQVSLENIKNTIELLEKDKGNLKQLGKYKKFSKEYKSFYIRAVFNIYLQGLYYESNEIREIETLLLLSKFTSYLSQKDIYKKVNIKYRIMIFLYKIKILKIFLKIMKKFGLRIN